MAERKRDPMTRAVASSWSGQGHSIMADNWPGVLLSGENWRVILTRDACRYRLQHRRQGATRWEPVYGASTPLQWSQRLASAFPDLPEKLQRLPADPKDALAVLAVGLAVPVPQARRVHYWTAHDYSGVLRTIGNVRSVRDRTGTVYAVQWVKPAALDAGKPLHWITQHKGPAWSALVDLIAPKISVFENSGADLEEKRALVAALFEGLPERAADGPWPVVKVQSPRPRAKR